MTSGGSQEKEKKGRRRFRLPVQLRFTREGKWFCWITLAVGFAAVNTGNNLLYLLLGMMLSLIIISGILCNVSLSQLKVERILPRHIFAGAPCLVTLSVTNQKRLFASFSIEVEDRIEGREKGKKCYFLKVGAGRTQQTAYRLTLERRGEIQFHEVRVSSKFPFSLFLKTRILTLEDEALVLPRIYPVTIPTGLNQQSFGAVSQAKRGHGSDFFSLREMLPGDEMRWIHWPSTARTGNFQVREFQEEHRLRVELMLWHGFSPPGQPSALQLDPGVDFAASLLMAFFRRRQPVRFSTMEESFSLTESPLSLEVALAHLARLKPVIEKEARVAKRSTPSFVIVPDAFAAPSGLPADHILRASPAPAST